MSEKKNINVLVGANIKREREKAGYTQETLSEKIGIGVKSLSAIERGAVGVSLNTLKRICEVLAVSSNVLLFEQSQNNDVSCLTERLERLTPDQFEIVSAVVEKMLETFAHKEQI